MLIKRRTNALMKDVQPKKGALHHNMRKQIADEKELEPLLRAAK